MAGLVLNIIPIEFNSEKATIGKLRMDKESYDEFTRKNSETHAFRYDAESDFVQNIPIKSSIKPLGDEFEVLILENLPLLARAIQGSIFEWLSNNLRINRRGKKIIFWGKQDSALLLTQSAKKLGLPTIPNLEVLLKYEVDCRIFRYDDNKSFLGLVVDLATSNIIDIPISDLQDKGYDVIGKYVCKRLESDQENSQGKLETVGQVSSIDGNSLKLIDTEGATEIESSHAYLEPRLENFHDVINLYYGNKAAQVIDQLNHLRRPINTAKEKLALIKKTVDLLKNKPIVLGELGLSFGNVIESTDKRFPNRITAERPNLLFGAQGRNNGSVPDLGITNFGPYMYLHNERNSPVIAVVCEAQYKGRVEQFLNLLRSGYPAEMWTNNKRSNPFPNGLIGKYRLSNIRFEYEVCSDSSPRAYIEATEKLLNRLPSSPDLAIVQIKEDFIHLYGDTNPYFVSKSTFMMAGVPTQSIQIEKIQSPGEDVAYLLNTISLAIYAKLDGMPWVISTIKPTTHEIVVGLGSADAGTSRLSSKTKYVGITSLFQGDGRYLIWGATREVEYQKYLEALIESLRGAVEFVRQQNAWQIGDKVRIVCHVYKRLKDIEISAIKTVVGELAENNFTVEFAFLDISQIHPYYIFDPSQQGNKYWNPETKSWSIRGIGVPQRGLALQLDESRGLLHLTGPTDIKTSFQGIPRPLLVELHSDSDFRDMTYLLRQIYHFTYMSWRSFFPATVPITIGYSRLIARLLGNLKTVENWNSNIITVGTMRARKWFL
ncbi:MAG: hypothetical protein FJZ86_03725 [Chloroflexi bacterium]|nr:hypothetical protein [Chloroflexota bacterium]